ncbi:hypothetical protein M271_34295 [Streptomyces rapamycinicus NRRL 5491]|nr:hypothetical protein M271_34295 [Streptomyces rapamycinicus NRRL 5491]
MMPDMRSLGDPLVQALRWFRQHIPASGTDGDARCQFLQCGDPAVGGQGQQSVGDIRGYFLVPTGESEQSGDRKQIRMGCFQQFPHGLMACRCVHGAVEVVDGTRQQCRLRAHDSGDAPGHLRFGVYAGQGVSEGARVVVLYAAAPHLWWVPCDIACWPGEYGGHRFGGALLR